MHPAGAPRSHRRQRPVRRRPRSGWGTATNPGSSWSSHLLRREEVAYGGEAERCHQRSVVGFEDRRLSAIGRPLGDGRQRDGLLGHRKTALQGAVRIGCSHRPVDVQDADSRNGRLARGPVVLDQLRVQPEDDRIPIASAQKSGRRRAPNCADRSARAPGAARARGPTAGTPVVITGQPPSG